MNKYGTRLKQLREENGYTQETLAKRLNTSRSRIGMYEQGKRQPDFEMQEAIADLFNVSIDYLFGRNVAGHEQDDLISTQKSKDLDKATELYAMYTNASPEVRAAVELLLKAAPQNPASVHKNEYKDQ